MTDTYVDPNHRPKICACCGVKVRVMAEWFDSEGDIYCGSACRRGVCNHIGRDATLAKRASILARDAR